MSVGVDVTVVGCCMYKKVADVGSYSYKLYETSVGFTSNVPRFARIHVKEESFCRQQSEWNKYFDSAQLCAGERFSGMPCDVGARC